MPQYKKISEMTQEERLDAVKDCVEELYVEEIRYGCPGFSSVFDGTDDLLLALQEEFALTKQEVDYISASISEKMHDLISDLGSNVYQLLTDAVDQFIKEESEEQEEQTAVADQENCSDIHRRKSW